MYRLQERKCKKLERELPIKVDELYNYSRPGFKPSYMTDDELQSREYELGYKRYALKRELHVLECRRYREDCGLLY